MGNAYGNDWPAEKIGSNERIRPSPYGWAASCIPDQWKKLYPQPGFERLTPQSAKELIYSVLNDFQ